MYKVGPRYFMNELGNEIELHGLALEGHQGGYAKILFSIIGPDSKTSSTLTLKEAEQLRDLLIELIEQAE